MADSGDRFELPLREDPVFAGIDDRKLEVGEAFEAARGDVEFQAAVQRHRLSGIQVDGLAMFENRAVVNTREADQRSRLHLFDDRLAVRAGHQEQQPGVCEGNRGLGHELGRWSVLAVGIGDVQSHAAGSRGPHLQVEAGPRVVHSPAEDQNMSDELWHRLGQDQSLDIVCGARLYLRRMVTSWNLADRLLGNNGRGVHVLVTDGSRSVDAVDNDVGAVAEDQSGQTGPLVGVVEGSEQIGENPFSRLGVFEKLIAMAPREILAEKSVSPLADDFCG